MLSFALLAVLPFLATAAALFPDCVNGPLRNNTVCNASASTIDRARALVSAMTVEEKLNNTGNNSPGVPRLGLPAYQWWNEALHGIANSPGVNFSVQGEYSYSTSFPQPILMGAAFDDELINAVATVVSTEARAFNNANRSGLDYWTPNINPFKDPRWGRGQETPGEDPFHIASYVKALIDGLQGGNDDKYRRVVATCKHWVGYDMENWNGNLRYGFDAQINSQDYAEYYTPAFQACARDSNVGAFMCSYNAVNGVPTCADSYILETILRQHWNWTDSEHWVTSDCDSIQNIYSPHNFTSTREEAVAAALNAGTDLDCGRYYQRHLPGALSQGLINETTLDRSLTRQYSSLIRLGYFDPPESQPYRALSWRDIATNVSSALAYRAAVSGITLLKNDGTLPLSLRENSTVAILGDWANSTSKLQGNYFGNATYLRTPWYALSQLPNIIVTYANGPSPSDPTTDNWVPIFSAAEPADIIIYVSGISNADEAEEKDRTTITWGQGQLDVIEQLSTLGKPMVVVQMGGGQIDSSPIVNNPNIGGLLWGGYPGQDGGTALIDIITGKASPAGRLPITQYPASYVREVPMTDMALRPGPNNPGRTYRWYEGTPIFPFGFGLHYTNFSVSVSKGKTQTAFDTSEVSRDCQETYLDLCPLARIPINVANTGAVASDYVTLGFIRSAVGPAPYPKKTLVAYERLHNISPGQQQTAYLNLTASSLSRVLENGDRVLFPGEYVLEVDTPVRMEVNITVTGEEVVLDRWPQQPTRERLREQNYFGGGWGST